MPQPDGVLPGRRLLEACGALDESYHFIFDFELFFRFGHRARVRKLERTQALYRIHTRSKTSDWNQFLVELYRFSRPHWPGGVGGEFRGWLRDYVRHYMRRRHGGRRRDMRFWPRRAGLTALVRPDRDRQPFAEARCRGPRSRPPAENHSFPPRPARAPLGGSGH